VKKCAPSGRDCVKKSSRRAKKQEKIGRFQKITAKSNIRKWTIKRFKFAQNAAARLFMHRSQKVFNLDT